MCGGFFFLRPSIPKAQSMVGMASIAGYTADAQGTSRRCGCRAHPRCSRVPGEPHRDVPTHAAADEPFAALQQHEGSVAVTDNGYVGLHPMCTHTIQCQAEDHWANTSDQNYRHSMPHIEMQVRACQRSTDQGKAAHGKPTVAVAVRSTVQTTQAPHDIVTREHAHTHTTQAARVH